jgi:hypothetical protein
MAALLNTVNLAIGPLLIDKVRLEHSLSKQLWTNVRCAPVMPGNWGLDRTGLASVIMASNTNDYESGCLC